MSPTSSGTASSSSSSLSTAASSLCLLAIGALVGAASALCWRHLTHDRWRSDDERASIADGVAGLVGNTPLVRIRSLSEATGCEVSVPWSDARIESLRKDRGQAAREDEDSNFNCPFARFFY